MVPLVLLIGCLCCLPAGSALRFLAANIPVYKRIGENTTLLCDYDLEGSSLYSVKWYKDDLEFYRYMPRSRPPKHVFSDIPGVVVDVHRSDEIRVQLNRLDMDSTGRYRCEVSAEAPNFDTINNYGTMVVVVLPQEDPIITSQDDMYEPDGLISLNCTSERSKPAAQLMWFINEKRVGHEFLVPHSIIQHADGLETSILGLQIPLRSVSFRDDQIRLTCVAYIKAFNYASATTDVIASFEQPRDSVVQQRKAYFLVQSDGRAVSESSGRVSATWLSSLCLLLALVLVT